MSDAALQNLIKLADGAQSRLLVEEIIRTAYALGYFDAALEQTKAQISQRQPLLSKEVLS